MDCKKHVSSNSPFIKVNEWSMYRDMGLAPAQSAHRERWRGAPAARCGGSRNANAAAEEPLTPQKLGPASRARPSPGIGHPAGDDVNTAAGVAAVFAAAEGHGQRAITADAAFCCT